MKFLALLLVLFFTTAIPAAELTAPAAKAINSFGVELLRKTGRPDANAVISPYCIETAMAMAYAGADGETRDEMRNVLRYSSDDQAMQQSFVVLQRWMAGVVERSEKNVEELKHSFHPGDPISLTIANRLYGQKDFHFRDAFLELMRRSYDAPLEFADFRMNPDGAAKSINDWVSGQTKGLIRNVIPAGALSPLTRLVVVNAVYLKAPWDAPFFGGATRPLPFHLANGKSVDVPTMETEEPLGYARFKDFTAVTIPYRGGELQFLILLPDDVDGVAGLESKLTKLGACANLPSCEVILHLPKFKLEPGTLALTDILRGMGMETAFDSSKADFSRMADKGLFISDVFHKTYLSLDEQGVEAAAAAIVDVGKGIPEKPPQAIELRVDHPFIFAIQHRASGACLFLGHVVDPR